MEKNISEIYLITKDDFDFYLETFENQFKPISVMQIPIILPFQFPVPDNTHFGGCSIIGKYGFIFKFKKLKIEQNIQTDLSIVNALFQEKFIIRTYVEMMYISKDELKFENKNQTFGDEITSTLLKDLNSILIGYSFLKNDIDVYRVTNQMLYPLSMVRCYNITDWENNAIAFAGLNSNFKSEKKDLADSLVSDLINYTFSSKILFNSLLNSELFAIDSLDSYRKGLRKEAVVNIQTSIESFIKVVFILLAAEENIDSNKVENILGNFKNLICHQFKNRIGGVWDIDDEKCEVGDYFSKTYNLRNAIVHSGYNPKFIETNTAIQSALKFKEYVLNLIKKSCKDKICDMINTLYFNRDESFASQIFKNDLKFDLVKNQGELSKMISKLNESLNKNNP
jgi:hypothetical protein